MLEQLIWDARDLLDGREKCRGGIFFIGYGQSLIDWAGQGAGVVKVDDRALTEAVIEKVLPEANFVFVTQDLVAHLSDRIVAWNQARHCVVVLPTPDQQGLGSDLIAESVKKALGVDILAKEVV